MKKIILILLVAFGCSKKPEYKIQQIYKYERPATYSYSDLENWGWKLSTYVYEGDNIIYSTGIMTEKPDTIRLKYIQEAKKFLEWYKVQKDTIIYVK